VPTILDPEARKALLQCQLTQRGIPINPHLPLAERATKTKPRTADEIAGQLVALTTVAVKGEGLEQEHVDMFIASMSAQGFLIPKELQFINDPNPHQHDRKQFAWRCGAT
jgi:hypothetical protein